MKHYLFVYGSMKKDFINHNRLINERFIGNAITKNKYNMYPDSLYLFPYVIENENTHHIKGELYFLRSMFYFESIKIFGPYIPYIDETVTENDPKVHNDKDIYAIVSKDEIELDGFTDHYQTGDFGVYYFGA